LPRSCGFPNWSRASPQGFGAVGIDELVDVVIDLYAPLAEERGCAAVGNGDARRAVCDAQLMVEAMSNLVDNAIKFSPPGGMWSSR
jgi:signal transduction histidine kinase